MQHHVGLVLAAGTGRRHGQAQAATDYGGRCLLDRAVATLRDGGCRQVLAVLGAQAKQALHTSTEPFTPVLDRRWGRGLAASLQAGLAAVPDRYDGVVLTLVDQPRIEPEAVRRLIDAAAAGATMAVAVYGDRPGHPMLFTREHFDGLAARSRGDRAAVDYLAANAADVERVPCPGDAGESAAVPALALRR